MILYKVRKFSTQLINHSELSKFFHDNLLFAFAQSQLSFEQYRILRACLCFHGGKNLWEERISKILSKLFLPHGTLKERYKTTFNHYVDPSEISAITDPTACFFQLLFLTILSFFSKLHNQSFLLLMIYRRSDGTSLETIWCLEFILLQPIPSRFNCG